MATFFNRNSQYISSLVDYIRDTKPYHSKLTEVAEEYRFFDEMDVRITERLFSTTKLNSVWTEDYFSGGDSAFRLVNLKQLHSALNQGNPSNVQLPGTLRAFRDENTDFASIPFVYSKKAFDGVGVADVVIERQANRAILEPMVEGLDFFQSHGGIQLRLEQLNDTTGFNPLWAETRDNNLILDATLATRAAALDVSNPQSAVNQIRNLLNLIGGLPLSPTAQTLLNDLLTIIAIPDLPQDYEPFLNQVIADGTPVLGGFTGWIGNDGEPSISSTYIDEALSKLSPSLFFGSSTDLSFRESGKAAYESVETPYLRITNVSVAGSTAPGDTWRVVAVDSSSPTFQVFSSLNGYIGLFTAPGTFTSTPITFDAELIAQPPIGAEAIIKSRTRLVFSPIALTETWDIIKVNPLAYSRPMLSSTRYGYIVDAVGAVGLVTLLDTSLPSSVVTLTARANGITFDLTSTEIGYSGIATANVPYNDGRLAFTIRTGSASPFDEGDRFHIHIDNEPASVSNLNLGYGYDLDSYDNPNLLYNNTDSGDSDFNRPINFVFDTRFTDYDYGSMNLVVDETAVTQSWRLRAVPDLARPIATVKKDGSGPSVFVDLQDATSGVAPDPALIAAPLYSMLGDVDAAPDLALYYASEFVVEVSTDNFSTVTSLGTVPVGGSFSIGGVSFDLTPGSKPFIAVVSDDGLDPSVEGGDVFSFDVSNPLPSLAEQPVGLVATTGPRLVMHGDGFHEAPPANWTVAFTSSIDYTVTGFYTEGSVAQPVPGSPVSGRLTTPGSSTYEGASFNALNIHFTIVPGRVGFDAGDAFTFETYSRKPSYLVHGSTSGWHEPAVVGEPYWNGHLGFTIEKPIARLFAPDEVVGDNSWTLSDGVLSLSRLRFDATSCVYGLKPTANGWLVERNDIGAVGHLPTGGSFTDDFITLSFSGSTPIEATLQIIADDFHLWNAQDTIILNPAITAKLPVAGDYILVDKRTTDRFTLNLDQTNVDAPPSLSPLGINPLATSNIPIPLTIVPKDSTTSTAEFSDSGISHEIYSAGSGQLIGALRSTGASAFWPVTLEWDQTFFESYLKLNTSAIISTYGAGLNDKVHTRISESVKFIVGGGGLTTDYLFSDDINISVADLAQTVIYMATSIDGLRPDLLQLEDLSELTNLVELQNLNPGNTDGFIATIQDSPFGGFLPGFDNVNLDEEPEFYDTGVPLTDHFHQAQQLAGITPLTAAQQLMSIEDRQNRLAALINLIGNFLNNGDIYTTTLSQFLSNLDTDPIGTTIVPQFGLPARGLGIDITMGSDGADATKPSTDGVGAGIYDSMIVLAVDTAITHDTFNFDAGGLDATSDRYALIYTGELPPIPTPPLNLTSYADFVTPISIADAGFEARVIEINFQATPLNQAFIDTMPTPRVFIWTPDQPAPQQVAVVDRIASGQYRISTPAVSEAKLYVEPGP
jgi:hypothetical protein